jgi:hypothetical protein
MPQFGQIEEGTKNNKIWDKRWSTLPIPYMWSKRKNKRHGSHFLYLDKGLSPIL